MLGKIAGQTLERENFLLENLFSVVQVNNTLYESIEREHL
jgi:hypothetical protein